KVRLRHIEGVIDPRGLGERHLVRRKIDKAIAPDEAQAIAGNRFIRAKAEALEFAVDHHLEAIARARNAGWVEPRAQGVLHLQAQAIGLVLAIQDGRELHHGKLPRGGKGTGALAIHGLKTAGGQHKGHQHQDRAYGAAPHHTTRLTMRLGTMMTLRTARPSIARCTFSRASASRSMKSRSASLGASSVSRSLPWTWTAIVTWSSWSKAGSALGQ